MAERASGMAEGASGMAEGTSGMAERASGMAEGASGMAEQASGMAEQALGMAEGASGVAEQASGMAEGASAAEGTARPALAAYSQHKAIIVPTATRPCEHCGESADGLFGRARAPFFFHCYLRARRRRTPGLRQIRGLQSGKASTRCVGYSFSPGESVSVVGMLRRVRAKKISAHAGGARASMAPSAFAISAARNGVPLHRDGKGSTVAMQQRCAHMGGRNSNAASATGWKYAHMGGGKASARTELRQGGPQHQRQESTS